MKNILLIAFLSFAFTSIFAQGGTGSIEERKKLPGFLAEISLDTTIFDDFDSSWHRVVKLFYEREDSDGNIDTSSFDNPLNPPYTDKITLGQNKEQVAEYYFNIVWAMSARLARGLQFGNEMMLLNTTWSDYNDRVAALGVDNLFKRARDRERNKYIDWIYRFTEVGGLGNHFFRVSGNGLNLVEVVQGTWEDRSDGNEITGGKWRPEHNNLIRILNVYSNNIRVVPGGLANNGQPRWEIDDLDGNGAASYVITRVRRVQ